MNWSYLRHCAWVDTRAKFVAGVPAGGTLLDLGSSDGETLGHMAQLRPDLRLFAADIAGSPEKYPAGCQFHRADLEKERLPWENASMDAITCMHLVEHLHEHTLLQNEVTRLLKPRGRVYFETPHPKSLTLPSLRGARAVSFTLNFWDDPTHVQPVELDAFAQALLRDGLEIVGSGISRNWIFAAAYTLYFWFMPASRKKFTAYVHWLGWSAYLIARRPD
jgi:SAM-dependent methyltransferase